MQDWKQIHATGWTQQSKNTAPGDSLRSNRPYKSYHGFDAQLQLPKSIYYYNKKNSWWNVISINKILKSPWIYIVTTSGFQIIIAVGSIIIPQIGVGSAISIFIVAGMVNIFIVYKNFNRIKNKDDLVNEILELCIRNTWNDDLFGQYRTNIMFLNRTENMLYIKYHKNMRFSRDRLLKLRIGTGVAGIAFSRGVPMLGDLSTSKHSDFGIGSDQERYIWPDMKTLYSLPLINTVSNENEVFGVFNIDSSIELEQSGLGKENTQHQLRCFGLLLSSLLSDEF